MTSARLLAQYLVDETYAGLPAEVVGMAKSCLIDATGCLFGAYEIPIAKAVIGFILESGTGQGRLVGSSLRTSTSQAAFGNATLINALDFDDIYKKGHLGATVIGTALALAGRVDVSGKEFIEAIVTGYEVGARAGLSLRHDTPRKTIHGHGTWQTLGAATTAAKLLKLDVHEAAHALAVAASCAPVASVMKTVYGASPTMTKNNFGSAAETGMNAALLAAQGFEGPLDIFEGESGFWRMCGADGADLAPLNNGLGSSYEILEVGFKPYSCCRILQSSIEVAREAFRSADVAPMSGAFKSLTIRGPEILTQPPFSHALPETIVGVQFSAPFCIALAVSGIPPGPEWFSPSTLANAAVRELAQRVRIEPAPGSGERDGATHRAATAILQRNDGTVVTHAVPVALGEAANPMGKLQLHEKFLRLVQRRLGKPQSLGVLGVLDSLDEQRSTRQLVASLCPSNA